MVKKLPQLKKSLKSFILEEDAKVIDESAVKIAIVASFMAVNIVGNIDDVSAWPWSHKDHHNHNNHIFEPGELDLISSDSTGNGIDIYSLKNLNNLNSTNSIENAVSANGFTIENPIIPRKSILIAHANHYNQSGHGGWF